MRNDCNLQPYKHTLTDKQKFQTEKMKEKFPKTYQEEAKSRNKREEKQRAK